MAETLFADTANSSHDSSVGSNDEQAARLQREIQLLDENAREIIVMKVFGELTFDEIGSVLNTPAATIATRYRRALASLEEKLRRNL